MTGVLLNVVTIIVGTVLGVSVGRFIHDRYHEIAFWAIGLCTLGFGVSMIVRGFGELNSSALGDYSLLVIVGSMVVGAFIGELIGIEKWLERFGKKVQSAANRIPFFKKKDSNESSSTFVDGFMTASILYCVGPMTILGSIQAGLGDPATIYLKSVLDGTAAIMLSTTLGIGVGFSILPVLIFQGALALGAHAFASVFSSVVISAITAVGGILIIAISLDILKIKHMRVANMLPALVIIAVIGGFFG